MKIISAHLRLSFLQLLRQPSYIVSTLIFPSLFFLLFALPNARDKDIANILLASFAAFAVLGVIFFQFAVETSVELASPWSNYLRTLPLQAWQLVCARGLIALGFALVAAWIVMSVALVSSPAHLNLAQFAWLNLALVLGSVPFTLLALTVGHWVPSQSALPISNLLYIVFSFAGGLWMPPSALPEKVRTLSDYLPTRAYGEFVWGAVTETAPSVHYVLSLVFYTLVAGALLCRRLRKVDRRR